MTGAGWHKYIDLPLIFESLNIEFDGFTIFFLLLAIHLNIFSDADVDDIDFVYVDISNLPLLNTDLEEEGTYPLEVEDFRDYIRGADGFLFASPEYNYSVSGTYIYTAYYIAYDIYLTKE